MKSVDDRSRGLPVALALVVLLVAYGSLFPFQWNFNAPQAFIWSGRIGLVDLIENIALFVPLGGLLGWAGHRETARVRMVEWFGLCPDPAVKDRAQRRLAMYLN